MANFFDQFDQSGDVTPDGRPRITVRPVAGGYDKAISSIESGGNYRSVGPATRDGDRALGKYQVMGKNVGPWTKEALGQELTPQQFLANDDAQEAVFKHKFGGYVDKYGPEGAARAWFAGEGGMNDPNRRDVMGTIVADYGRKFTSALGPQSAPRPVSPAAPQSGKNFFDQFDGGGGQFDTRFAGEPAPPPNQKLAAALPGAAAQLTRGEPTSPAANMAIDAGNQLSAASQGTTPHIDAYQGRLLSTEVHQDDAGNILFRDPQTGKMVQTDSAKHVALRDPGDNTVKVYSRDAATNESPAVSVSRVLAPGLAAGAVTARPAIAAASKAIQPRASDIFSTAKPHYRAFTKEAGGIEVPARASKAIVEHIHETMAQTVPAHLADEVYKSVSEISKGAPKELTGMAKVQAEMNGLPTVTAGTPIALDHLRDAKELVGQSFKSNDPRVRQAAGIASREIEKIISAVSETAGSSLKTADKIQSTAHSLRQFDGLMSRAGAMETRKLYRGNVGEKMREYLSKIVTKADDVLLKDPNASTKAATGFTNEEVSAFREYVEARKAVRYAAEASPTKGIMRTFMEGAAVTAAGPAALAIPAIGYSANVIARALDKNQLGRMRELIAKRSPAYAKAVEKSIQRYEQSQIDFANKPAPNTLAAYVSASRALSAGLTKDGIEVSSGALLKAITGPPKAAADSDEQHAPPIPGQ